MTRSPETQSTPAIPTFAVVTGGGTSGHVLPALAIADALVRAGRPSGSVHYVGGSRGVEATLLPATPFPFTLLDVVGLQRRVSRRNFTFLPKLLRSIKVAKRLLVELRPAVVVNVGGYASFPATYAARRLKIPYVVVSWDRRPGLVTKLVAGKAAACAVSDANSKLPNAEVTGAPIRAEIAGLDRATARSDARRQLGLPADRFVVAVMCGSLGAASVNQVVTECCDRLAARHDLAIYHVAGERFLAQAAPPRDGAHGILYAVVGYEQRMSALYAAADLLVTRAGASTLAEVTAVGAPAIVVPWADAAANHQLANAKALADRGAAILIEQSCFTAERLIAEIERFVATPGLLADLAEEAHVAGELHRSGRLAALIERVAAS